MALRSIVADELRHNSREQVLNDLEELREALREQGQDDDVVLDVMDSGLCTSRRVGFRLAECLHQSNHKIRPWIWRPESARSLGSKITGRRTTIVRFAVLTTGQLGTLLSSRCAAVTCGWEQDNERTSSCLFNAQTVSTRSSSTRSLRGSFHGVRDGIREVRRRTQTLYLLGRGCRDHRPTDA